MLEIILYSLGGVAIVMIALWGHLTFWGWYYRQREVQGTLSWVYSNDGWRIALEHLPARKGVTPKGQVICCPGLACNGRIFHFRDGLSMASSLSEEGWSVWILHPRGAGPSERVDKTHWEPYSYQEYVTDAFTALEFVKERAPHLPMMWIGHSLGGVIGLEVATQRPELLQGIVTLGSPINLSQHPITARHYALFKWFCRGLKIAYLGKLSTLVAPWSGWFPFLHPPPLYVNFKLLKKADLRTSLAQCFDDVPRVVIDDFVTAIDHDIGPWPELRSRLKELKIPLLAFAGGRDGLAPLIVTTPIQELVPQVEWYLLEEYGHLELALSEGVEHDIMPRLSAWWDQVSTTLELNTLEKQQTEERIDKDDVGPSAIA